MAEARDYKAYGEHKIVLERHYKYSVYALAYSIALGVNGEDSSSEKETVVRPSLFV